MTDRIPVKGIITSGAATGLGEFEPGDQIANEYLHAAPPILSGAYLSRPAYTSVPEGTMYEATDTGEIYRSTASAWALMPGGRLLGLATITSSEVRAPGATAVIPGLAVTFTAGEGVPVVEFGGTFGNDNAAVGNSQYFMIKLDGAVVSQLIFQSNGGFITSCRSVPLPGLSAGSSHAITIEFQSIGTGTSTLYSLAVDRPYLMVKS
jgi:hypothetical protein